MWSSQLAALIVIEKVRDCPEVGRTVLVAMVAALDSLVPGVLCPLHNILRSCQQKPPVATGIWETGSGNRVMLVNLGTHGRHWDLGVGWGLWHCWWCCVLSQQGCAGAGCKGHGLEVIRSPLASDRLLALVVSNFWMKNTSVCCVPSFQKNAMIHNSSKSQINLILDLAKFHLVIPLSEGSLRMPSSLFTK